MALSRALSQQERWFIKYRINIANAVEMKTPRLADEFVAFLIDQVAGFRLRTDDKNFFVVDTPPEVEKLPPRVNTVFGMCDYGEYGLQPDYAKRLGRIAQNGRYVAWNVPHGLYDGVSCSILAANFERGKKLPTQIFPDAVDHALADQLATVKDPLDHVRAIAGTTKVEWSHPPIKVPDGCRNASHLAGLPYESFLCYNPKTNKFVGLTDVFWRAALLVAHAHTPGQTSYRFSTWVNLRPYMKPTGTGNTITTVVVDAPGAHEGMTIQQLEEVVRRDFAAKVKAKTYLTSLACFNENVPFVEPTSCYFDVSNSGYYPQDKKIVDMFLIQSMTADTSIVAFGLGAATNFGGSRDRQFFRLPYSQCVFTHSDTARIWAALIHSMQHHPKNMTVGEAVRDLRNVMDKME
jgi:hypothetical protein